MITWIGLSVLFLVICCAVPLTIGLLWDPPLLAWIACCVAWGLLAGQWFSQVTRNVARRRWEEQQ